MLVWEGQRALPPLPEYQLTPTPSLIPGISDKFLTLIAPHIAYWSLSLFFHWIDRNNFFAKYRLHTPAEVLKRNHVSRWEVFRDVVVQQVIQTGVGQILNITEPDDFSGKEEYDITVWGRRIRLAQRLIPTMLAFFGIDPAGLSRNLADSHPLASGALAGGIYPTLGQLMISADGESSFIPIFASWETQLAKALYWVIVPALQFFMAILVVDTWQYFLHRAMHMNKWLYSEYTYSPI